jgi:hypothetical protein
MPYISEAMREALDRSRLRTVAETPAGELNYLFTLTIIRRLHRTKRLELPAM